MHTNHVVIRGLRLDDVLVWAFFEQHDYPRMPRLHATVARWWLMLISDVLSTSFLCRLFSTFVFNVAQYYGKRDLSQHFSAQSRGRTLSSSVFPLPHTLSSRREGFACRTKWMKFLEFQSTGKNKIWSK